MDIKKKYFIELTSVFQLIFFRRLYLISYMILYLTDIHICKTKGKYAANAYPNTHHKFCNILG